MAHVLGIMAGDKAIPPLQMLVVFVAGVIVMRAAGCVINDYADRKVEGRVDRTKHRPLVSGAVSAKEAKLLFVILALIAFALVLTMNLMTIMLSVVGMGLSLYEALYPSAAGRTGGRVWLGDRHGLVCG